MANFEIGDIERAVGPVSLARGLDYFWRGKVRRVSLDAHGQIRGEVSGSRADPYTVTATCEVRHGGRLLPAVGHCSCPVGHNCKHTAAVLLAARNLSPKAGNDTVGRAVDDVGGKVRRWLDRWPGAGSGRAKDPPSGALATGRDRLFYVICHDKSGGMCINPYRAYVKKDGAIGKNVRRYDERGTFGSSRFATAEDAALLGRLEYYATHLWSAGHDWPEGDELVGLVRGIVETGRARAGDIRGIALSWSAPRRCTLAWTMGQAGRQRIEARDGTGLPVTLLPFPTPLFMEPKTGAIGVAETDMPDGLASWFAGAPSVAHGAVGAVMAKLSRGVRDAAL